MNWRRLIPGLALTAAAGCALTADDVCRNVILPEQRTIDYRDPATFPPAPIPPSAPPRTVAEPRPEEKEWSLSLDEAIRVALENAKVVRVLTGVGATSSGQTIYDPAITNTTIDQEQGRFDPTVAWNNTWNHNDAPAAILDRLDPLRAVITGSQTDEYLSRFGLSKTNVLGGQWNLNWTETPVRFDSNAVLLNPQNHSALELSYTQPLLQGGGLAVNTAPIVIARLNTERSFFQFKDSVQELVRGTVEAYWNLVQARVDEWARRIQVEQSQEAYQRELARQKSGMSSLGPVAQARVTYNQFRANLIAAQATVLTREGALRNLLGLPPDDDRRIVPSSAPTGVRVKPRWDEIVALGERRRPDIVELKLILEADQYRKIQADNGALPRLDATALYRWNGLDGVAPNGERVSSGPGQFTDWALGLNFSVPIGLRQARALVRQTELLIVRDKANLEQGVHAAVHELAATVRDLDNAFEQYLAYKETRAAAYDNLKVQIEEFRAQRAIYLNVLQALNDWGNAVSSEAGSLLTYNVLLGTLERQTGTILETHGLVFFEERFRAAGPLGLPCGDRYYPSAIVPEGSPTRYPGKNEPSENAFDLKKPDIKGQALPLTPPDMLPRPKPVAPDLPKFSSNGPASPPE